MYDMGFLGLGVTNWSVLKYMVSENKGRFFVSSLTPIDVDKKKYLFDNGIDFEESQNSEKILNSEVLMISPSVRPDNPLLEKAADLGVKVKIDIELFLESIKSQPKTIAITGTNGKTTTVEMITHIVSKQKKAYSLGNIGKPTFDYMSEDLNEACLIFELSSFQIKHIKKNRKYFNIAGITNISEDHLDWHGGYTAYKNDKLRIAALSELLLIPSNLQSELLDSVRVQVYDKNEITEKIKIPANIKGEHNIKNATLAALCCLQLGIHAKSVYDGLLSFEFGEHRMEEFLIKNGRIFINDSKSTNAHSLLWALKSVERKVILLAGAKDKGDDYKELGEVIVKKVKKAYLCGESAQRLFENIPSNDKELFEDWESAIKTALLESEYGDIILFSPGGSSFDKFKNYKERGLFFKRYVKENA